MDTVDTQRYFALIDVNIPYEIAEFYLLPLNADKSPFPITTKVLKDVGFKSDLNLDPMVEKAQYTLIEKFIFVIVGQGNMVDETLLNQNIRSALMGLQILIYKRKIWIPAIGVGEGVKEIDCYNWLSEAIWGAARMPTPNEFYLSLPSIESSYQFKNEMEEQLRNKADRRFFIYSLSFTEPLKPSGRHQRIPTLDEIRILESEYLNIDDIIFCNKANVGRLDGYDPFDIPRIIIDAIGVVYKLENKAATIRWTTLSTEISLGHTKSYNRGISHLSDNDLQAIMQLLEGRIELRLVGLTKVEVSAIIERTSLPDISHIQPIQGPSFKLTIPGLLNDTDTSTDHLNISNDVKAFARIIASGTFEPPLAIALFGKWGAGKSFFMRQLQQEINALKQRDSMHLVNGKTERAYKKGIVDIHFNAWSYMDANLWASLISRIFEVLDTYITQEHKNELALQKVKALLSSQLVTLSDKGKQLQDAKDELDNELDALGKEKDALEKSLKDQKIAALKNTFQEIIKNIDAQFDVKARIRKDLENNKSFQYSVKQIQSIVPEEDWKNPEAAYEEAKSGFAWLQAFFTRGKIWKNMLWMIGIVALIIAIPIGLEFLSRQISNTPFYIPPVLLQLFAVIVPVLWNARQTIREWKPVIASFWKIKEEYEAKVDTAKAEAAEKQIALELKIAEDSAKLLRVNEEIAGVNTRIKSLDAQLTHALSTTALHNFISQRWASDDYSKHLGIISVIRKDLETLNVLFAGHQAEVKNGLDLPDLSESLKTPLERIILYIDDLDRCPEETVVQVLEAVNLLMAFPLFVVVVGVDASWVKRALERKHKQMPDGGTCQDPAAYLEKIFQIPFHLKSPDDTVVKDMIAKLAGEPQQEKEKANLIVMSQGRHEELHQQTSVRTESTEETLSSYVDSIPAEDTTPHHEEEVAVAVKERIEILSFTATEIEIMQQMSVIIGNNPRTIKRFVNIFRVIKAHEDYTCLDGKSWDLSVVIFMVALSVGPYRDKAMELENLFSQPESNIKNVFRVFVDSYETFQQVLSLDDISYLESDMLKKHYAFIRRFSFKGI
ncbi:KAP-like P-loop domain-containing protein [Chitinophaga dinghuensis]|uniref:KAP-like P-loop domain-containing protein n=1 Tax=Chitinophaga dinghuensis TaxID=1539050 RepID=A0A327VZF3_9BACT|nr:P-loop NTPase fold protein [Chitinophaga dinghuensis]RAJ80336.1 KAP-like P-loop domain-containing protein [Chitinophaga dinghuensis]